MRRGARNESLLCMEKMDFHHRGLAKGYKGYEALQLPETRVISAKQSEGKRADSGLGGDRVPRMTAEVYLPCKGSTRQQVKSYSHSHEESHRMLIPGRCLL